MVVAAATDVAVLDRRLVRHRLRAVGSVEVVAQDRDNRTVATCANIIATQAGRLDALGAPGAHQPQDARAALLEFSHVIGDPAALIGTSGESSTGAGTGRNWSERGRALDIVRGVRLHRVHVAPGALDRIVEKDAVTARRHHQPIDGARYRDVADQDMVPAVVFSDPQVASVGLTESRAREKGIDVEAVEYDLASVAGASLLRDGYTGRAKLVVDRATDTLVGATFVGTDVAELLHSATTAIVGRVPLETLWHVVPSYPTVSEVWLRLLEARG